MYRILLTLCLVALLASPAAGQEDRHPNIIFILADDLGYGDLGSYGQTVIQTPELDRMAAEGIRFTQFYAGATVCAPSRSVLMTGQHMGHTHVRGNAPGPRMHAQSLRDVDVTVAEVLKAAGYSTALFGKWGLGEVDLQGHPLKQGFDTFFGYLNQVHAHNYYPEFLWKGLERMPLRNKVQRVSRTYGGFTGGWATERNEYSHDVIMREAMAWLVRTVVNLCRDRYRRSMGGGYWPRIRRRLRLTRSATGPVREDPFRGGGRRRRPASRCAHGGRVDRRRRRLAAGRR